MMALLPVAEEGRAPTAATGVLAPLPAAGETLVLGLVDNSKAGAAVIVTELALRLAAKVPISDQVLIRKLHASLPMSQAERSRLDGVDVVVSALGDCGSCTSWTVKDAIALEAAGTPVIVVCSRPFEGFARAQARALGYPGLRILVIGHPIAELTDDEVRARVAEVADGFDQLWTEVADQQDAPARAAAVPAGSRRLDLASATLSESDPEEEFAELLTDRGMADGLPMVVPTRARVDAMLAGTGGDPDEVIGLLAPMHRPVSARSVAVVSVMAGCLPAYFPVVLAAIRALLDDEFNLNGVQTTTHPCGVFVVVSGPVGERIGMNCGINAFGPGNRANATIGRAVRLAQLAIGGARPGAGDMATLGSPAKYTFAAAENLPASPWGSLAESFGFAATDSVVTVVGAEAPQNINDHESKTGLGLLRMIAGTLRTTGANNSYYVDGQVVVVLSPEHARTLAADGYSRRDVQDYLWAEARTPIGYFSADNIVQRLQTRFPREFGEFGSHTLVPIVHSPDNILLPVIGGPGKHSMFVPTFGGTRAVSARVVDPE